MKVVVIACLEPEHLSTCLEALLLWVVPADILVVNNASIPLNSEKIDQVCAHYFVPVARIHNLCQGENTIAYINEALKLFCAAHPEEIILKIDEDIVLVSCPERFQFERGVFFVPNVTINNFTTKNYLRSFWTDLYEASVAHDWMWHNPHPYTGEDLRLELTKRFYTIHPKWLIRHCEEAAAIEYVDRADWYSKRLMSDRGISSTAMAFHAADYLSLVGPRQGVEEIFLAEGVLSGRHRYKVDYGMFCHHVNYFSIRPLVKANKALVDTFVRRILEHYQSQRPALGR